MQLTMLNEDHPIHQIPIPRDVKVRIMPCLDFWIPRFNNNAIAYFNKYFDRAGSEMCWHAFIKEAKRIDNLEFEDTITIYDGCEGQETEGTIIALGDSVLNIDAEYFVQKEGDKIETESIPIVAQQLTDMYPDGYYYNETTFSGVRTKDLILHATNIAVLVGAKKIRYACDLDKKKTIQIKKLTKRIEVNYDS